MSSGTAAGIIVAVFLMSEVAVRVIQHREKKGK